MFNDSSNLLVNYRVEIYSYQLELVLGDITIQEVDAIVNAANPYLEGGGGVDGAIHRKGGPAIMKETREKYPSGCKTGAAVPSNAGNLKAKYIFHAVGPCWYVQPDRFDLLSSTYNSCLKLAIELNCKSVVFPSISTGSYGYPIKESSVTAVNTIGDFFRSIQGQNTPLEFVRFSLFSEQDFTAYHNAIDKYLISG